MSDTAPTERSDTQEAIMAATYRALCKHGYANLTTQAIADEFDMTKAVLHYHSPLHGFEISSEISYSSH